MELISINKSAIKIIDATYKDSQYNPDIDLYRIKDILNSVSNSQIESKQWLVDEITKLAEPQYTLILGGWYGVLMALLEEKWKKTKMESVDFDDTCRTIGLGMFPHLHFITDDALINYTHKRTQVDLLINTSCEHMEQEDIDYLLYAKPPETMICFQSNDYEEITSHINSKNSLEEFIDSLNLKEIIYSGTLPSFRHNRFMVIGK